MGACFLQRLRVLARLGLVALSLPALRAQDAPVEEVPVAEVNRRLTDPARTEPRPVRFRGSVIFVSRVGDFCVQEGAAGIMLERPKDAPPPVPGDTVEVDATIAYRTADLLDPGFYLPATAVRVTGRAELPAPERPWLAEALAGKTAGRRVEVEGVVMQATVQNGAVLLHLTDRSGWAVVNVHDWRPGTVTSDWWGARLRVRAANVGRGHTALRVTSSDDVTVLMPGTEEWFGAPVADVAALRQSGATADRYRLDGTVLHATADDVYVRSDAGVAFRTSLLAPFPPTTPQPHPLELLAPRKPDALAPGDRVELVASPMMVEPFLQTSFASVRLAGTGAPVPPFDLAGRNPADFACDVVSLSGRVQWHDGAGGAPRLEIDSAGQTVHVIPAEGDDSVEKWQPGDVLRATGLPLPAERGRPLTLRVSDGTRLERLSDPPSNWRALTPLARRWIALLAAGLGLALGGAWWLQRLVRQRTAALAGANDALQAEISVRKRAESDLARALEQERELGELKSRFVSMVSHEFRTPLGITMSAVELLQHYEDRLPPEQKAELLGDIQRSTKNMAGLMEQVLLLGRVEAGRMGYRPQDLELEAVCRKLADESLSATNRRCSIEWECDDSLAGAHGDEALIRHIVSNLLSNAVKYSPAGEEVRLAVRRDGPDAVITVRDRGIGIPHEDRARLFEAFHRCTNVGDVPGTGLGLVIVKRCVDLHQGSLDVESEPGAGTTFTVRLPLWPAA